MLLKNQELGLLVVRMLGILKLRQQNFQIGMQISVILFRKLHGSLLGYICPM